MFCSGIDKILSYIINILYICPVHMGSLNTICHYEKVFESNINVESKRLGSNSACVTFVIIS